MVYQNFLELALHIHHGLTLFENIYELKPAHFAIYNHSGLYTEKYWYMKSEKHTDDFDTTCEKINFLLTDSMNNSLSCNNPAIMLSRRLRFKLSYIICKKTI